MKSICNGKIWIADTVGDTLETSTLVSSIYAVCGATTGNTEVKLDIQGVPTTIYEGSPATNSTTHIANFKGPTVTEYIGVGQLGTDVKVLVWSGGL